MSARILIAVTHLLGSGHLVRARHLARALAAAGHAVTLASGGMPSQAARDDDITVVQLPPVRVEGVDFRTLLDESGRPIDAARRSHRRKMLEQLASSLRPDIVVTEHFPFGRRQLADEFLGLIAAAKAADPRVLVLSSIRDVLVAPRADRIAEAHRRLDEQFDGVLVHGDADILPVEASWPVTPSLSQMLHYTGYMAPPSLRAERSDPAGHRASPPMDGVADARDDATGDILVSGGGSGAALPLFRLCLDAARLSAPSRRWRLLVGRGTARAAFESLQAAAPANAAVEWARPDFAVLLANCALSISQAGYNTVLDLFAAGRPAIVVPFDEGAETEQAIRADAMARAGLASCLRLTGAEPLTPQSLAEAVDSGLKAATRPTVTIDRNGAAGSVAAIARLLSRRRA